MNPKSGLFLARIDAVPNPGAIVVDFAEGEARLSIVVTRRPDSAEAGEPATVYHFVSTAEGEPVETLTWVSKASGLPLQIQTTGGKETKFRYQIRYRDYDDPTIVIVAPK